MKLNILKISSILLGMMMVSQVSAQEYKDAMGFSRIARNPKAAAMGFAGAASTSTSAWAAFNNSAVIPFYEGKFDAQAIYQGWAPNGDNSSNIAAGLAYKTGKLGLSLGFVRQRGQKYEVFGATGASAGTFSPSDMQVGAGIGYAITENISAGVNARYLMQALSDDDTYSAFGADVFALYKSGPLSATVGISNIGSSVKDYSGATYNIATSVTAGFAYQAVFEEVHGIEAVVDADYFLSGNFTAGLGIQYSWDDLVFARAGYHVAGGDTAVLPSFATVGVGFKFSGVKIDIAYLTANEHIGNTITIGVGYTF